MAATRAGSAKARATELHSKIIRSRRQCERCGERDYTQLDCAHIVRRDSAHTRTDLTNAWCACRRCHTIVDQNREEFFALVDKTIGREKYEELRHKAHDGIRTRFDWPAEVERLREIALELRVL